MTQPLDKGSCGILGSPVATAPVQRNSNPTIPPILAGASFDGCLLAAAETANPRDDDQDDKADRHRNDENYSDSHVLYEKDT